MEFLALFALINHLFANNIFIIYNRYVILYDILRRLSSKIMRRQLTGAFAAAAAVSQLKHSAPSGTPEGALNVLQFMPQ
jgi:hypothetical protein